MPPKLRNIFKTKRTLCAYSQRGRKNDLETSHRGKVFRSKRTKCKVNDPDKFVSSFWLIFALNILTNFSHSTLNISLHLDKTGQMKSLSNMPNDTFNFSEWMYFFFCRTSNTSLRHLTNLRNTQHKN